MRLLGNVIWFVFGGALSGLLWWLIGMVAFISIVGIPWGRACFVIGQLSFFPFGNEVISRDKLTLREDIGTGDLGLVGNIIWFVLAGVWLALVHLLLAVLWCVTLIGIPFALQHLKLAGISIAPIGKTVVASDLADAARYHNRRMSVLRMRKETY